ncbi:MAG: TonB-dependent receptor [Candidatus Omnitrophica bacterium]|nr:TonB-dependent receptor [Candidatus Omnitrophota bacterium]
MSQIRFNLAAQEVNRRDLPSGDIISLERIVITPTRQQSFLKDVPSKVTVVTKEQIAGTGAETLDEVFRYLPEINIIGDSVYQGMKPQITLRGVPGQERTLVMIDGIPVNSAWQGRIEWRMVPIEAIERIELVHGPMSTLYGSGAMGGAMNVITKLPGEQSKTFLKGGYGSLNTRSAAFSQGGRSDKFSYYLGGGILKSRGYIPEKDPRSYSTKRAYKDWDSIFKLSYSIDDDSDLVLGLLHDDENTCRGRQYFNIHDKANLGYLTYERLLGDLRFKGTFFVNDQDWYREFDTGPNYDYLNMVESIDHAYIGAMTEMGLILSKINRLTAGFDYKKGSIRLKDEYQKKPRGSEANGRQDLAAFFIQNETRLLEDSLIFAFGIRGDYVRSYNGWCYDSGQTGPVVAAFSYNYGKKDWVAFSPKAGAVYHMNDKTILRASAGKAFHAPDLKELYLVLARPTKTVYNNPDLDPESLNSYEIGLSHNFFDGLEGGVSYFYSRGNDFIGTRTLSLNTSKYDNIDKVWMSGVETDLRYRLNKQWLCSLGHLFHISKIDEDAADSDLNGKYLAMQPNQQVNAMATYGDPKMFIFSVALRYVGRMYADNENIDKLKSHYSCDLKLAKKINKNIEIALICENIFDREYDVPNEASEDLRSPGRLTSGSVTVEW